MFKKEGNSTKVAIYVRVSTEEQNPQNQLLICEKYCNENACEIIDTYIDKKSGRTENRPEYSRMMKDALYHRFDVVIVEDGQIFTWRN